MRVISVNVGQPRIVETARGSVVTSIFKEPVRGRRKVEPHNFEGDRQSDLTVHGGPRKAVYAYAQEHYFYWRQELNETNLEAGTFGENLTVEGLQEGTLCIGDVVEVGSAQLRVTEPRMPCVKLAIRLNRPNILKRFWASGRSGIYFAVEAAGEIGAGDEMRVLRRDPMGVTVADVVDVYRGRGNEALYRRVMACPLQGGWREDIREKWELQA